MEIKLITYRSVKQLVILFSFIFVLGQLTAQTPDYPIKNINGVDCYEYTVQKSEGFYRIGLNFNTTESIIRNFNPQIGDMLSENMVIYIPVYKPEGNNSQYLRHKVERRQTVFAITRLYNITEEELVKLNPSIRNNTVREGDTLIIPIIIQPQSIEKIAENKEEINTKEEKQKREELSNLENKLKALNQQPVSKSVTDTLDIAFLLPFMLDTKGEPSDSRFVEFFAGAMVALQEAQSRGMHLRIHNLDTEKSELKLMELLQQNDLSKMDLIVGPTYSGQVSVISDFARMHKVKTLIPFTSKVLDLETNPYIYQFNPSQDVEIKKIQEILIQESPNANIIFAEVPNISVLDDGFRQSEQLKSFLTQNNITYNVLPMGPYYLTDIYSVLSSSKENIVFFNTNRISQVNSFLKEMLAVSQKYDLKIYEPYAWRSTRVEKPRSFYLSFFRDEFPEQKYDAYMNRFSSLFSWTPGYDYPRYDLLGYDLISYFLRSILINRSESVNIYPVFEGVQSDMQFEKASLRGGYINKQLYHYE